MIGFITLLSLLSANALAADNEVVFSVGSLTTTDVGWTQFSNNATPTYFSLRAATPLSERLSAVVDYRPQYKGVALADGFSITRTAYTQHLGALGFKANLPIHSDIPLVPYGVVEGVMMLGLMKLDDDRTDRDNPNQVRANAVTAGGYGAIGIDGVAPRGDFRVGFVGHIELGYLVHGPMDMGAVGTLRPQGVVFRVGAGLRF